MHKEKKDGQFGDLKVKMVFTFYLVNLPSGQNESCYFGIKEGYCTAKKYQQRLLRSPSSLLPFFTYLEVHSSASATNKKQEDSVQYPLLLIWA